MSRRNRLVLSYTTMGASVALLMALSACGTGSVSRPDAGDGDGGIVQLGDGGLPTGTSLGFEIELKPKLPGDVGGSHKLKIDDVLFELANVRAIGDAAPGDERTTIPLVTLTWAETSKELIEYPNAPAGIYSSFIANVVRYRIRGTVDPPGPGGVYDFEIEDAPPGLQTFNIALGGVRLEAGKPKVIKIDVELGDAIKELPWDTYPVDEGEIELDEDDSEMTDFRDAVFGAFMGE